MAVRGDLFAAPYDSGTQRDERVLAYMRLGSTGSRSFAQAHIPTPRPGTASFGGMFGLSEAHDPLIMGGRTQGPRVLGTQYIMPDSLLALYGLKTL